MANRIIQVTGLNSDGTAILSNNGNLTCDPGDNVQWNVSPNAGIASISVVYTGDSNVFSEGPTQVGNSKNWQGTVSDDAGGEDEQYTVNAVAEGSDKAVPLDPRITVNPK